jgi:hypothetical protein
VIGHRPLILALALAIGLPVASLGQATPSGVTIRWEVDPKGSASAVSVSGLKPEVLKSTPADRWPDLLSISVESRGPKPADRPSMLGSYRVEGESLRFTPRYPFDRGRTYMATFRPSKLTGGNEPEITSSHLIPKPTRPATLLTGVTPSSDRVPDEPG